MRPGVTIRNQTLLTSSEGLVDMLRLLDGDDLQLAEREDLRAAIKAAQRPSITWASPRPGHHVIDGQPVDSRLVGLMAAHLAFLSQLRNVVRAADMAAPGSTCPDDVVRKALKTAALFIGPLNMRAAAAVRLVHVVDGFVYFAPDGRFDVTAS